MDPFSVRAASHRLHEESSEKERLPVWQDAVLLLEKGVSTLKQTLEEHTAELDGQKTKLTQLETENGELKAKIKRRDGTLNRMKEENVRLLEIQKTQKSPGTQGVKEEFLESSHQLQTLRAEKTQLEKEKIELQARLEQQNYDANSLRDQLRTSKQETESLKSDRNVSTSQTLSSYEEVPTRGISIRRGLDRSRSIESDLAAEREKVARLSKALDQSNDREKSLKQELSAEKITNRDLSGKLSEITENYGEQLETEKASLRDQIVSSEIARRDQEIKELNQRLESQQSRINDLTKQLSDSNTTTSTITKQLEVLQEELDESIEAKNRAETRQSRSQSEQDKRSNNEIDRLKSELNEKARQLAAVEDQLQETIASQDKNKQAIEKRVREAKDATRNLRKQNTKLEELEAQQAELRSALELARRDYQALSTAQAQGRTDTEQQQDLIAKKNQEISALKSKHGRLESKVMDVQGFAVELRKIASRSTTDDGDIRSRLEYEFRAGTRSWAKDWAAKSFDGNHGRFSKGGLRLEFQKVAEVRKDMSLQQQLQSVNPRLVVDALLSHYLVDRIFRGYQERTAEQNGGDGTPIESGLSKVLIEFYKMFIHVDEDKADTWRTQTINLLQKSKLGALEDSKIETQLSDDLDKLAEDFLASPVQLFLQPVPEFQRTTRMEQLIQLMKATVDLATYISRKQSAVLQIADIESCRNRPFRHDSLQMEADRSHHMDPDDDSRDGASIRMVVKPGFFVSEQEDTEPKVWAKTVVLLQPV